MENYKITLEASVISSLTKDELESKLIVSLFDLETEIKISDGNNDKLQVVDYILTEVAPITKNNF
jgi:hypothetical protein